MNGDQAKEFMQFTISINWQNALTGETYAGWVLCYWQCVAIAEAVAKIYTDDDLDEIYLMANIARLHADRVSGFEERCGGFPPEACRTVKLTGRDLSGRVH